MAQRACEVDGCTRFTRTRSSAICEMHYYRLRRRGEFGSSGPERIPQPPVCSAPECARSTRGGGRGYCPTHYRRLRNTGDVRADDPIRAQGGGTVTRQGYRMLWRPGHPNASGAGHIFEHRCVMAEALGRPLAPEETVHHKNGDRLDNRLANLELWTSRHAWGQRVDDLTQHAVEHLRLYAPHLLVEG